MSRDEGNIFSNGGLWALSFVSFFPCVLMWHLAFDSTRQLEPLPLLPGAERILGRAWFKQHGLTDERLVSCISRQHVGLTVGSAATPSLTLRRITPNNDVTLDGQPLRVTDAQGTEVRDGAEIHLLVGALVCTATREPPPRTAAAAAAVAATDVGAVSSSAVRGDAFVTPATRAAVPHEEAWSAKAGGEAARGWRSEPELCALTQPGSHHNRAAKKTSLPPRQRYSLVPEPHTTHEGATADDDDRGVCAGATSSAASRGPANADAVAFAVAAGASAAASSAVVDVAAPLCDVKAKHHHPAPVPGSERDNKKARGQSEEGATHDPRGGTVTSAVAAGASAAASSAASDAAAPLCDAGAATHAATPRPAPPTQPRVSVSISSSFTTTTAAPLSLSSSSAAPNSKSAAAPGSIGSSVAAASSQSLPSTVRPIIIAFLLGQDLPNAAALRLHMLCERDSSMRRRIVSIGPPFVKLNGNRKERDAVKGWFVDASAAVTHVVVGVGGGREDEVIKFLTEGRTSATFGSTRALPPPPLPRLVHASFAQARAALSDRAP